MGVLRVVWDPENSGCTDGGHKLKNGFNWKIARVLLHYHAAQLGTYNLSSPDFFPNFDQFLPTA